jgi:hypothetical protein
MAPAATETHRGRQQRSAVAHWIYFRDPAGRWMPAVTLPFADATAAEGMLDALSAAHPAVSMRLEHE